MKAMHLTQNPHFKVIEQRFKEIEHYSSLVYNTQRQKLQHEKISYEKDDLIQDVALKILRTANHQDIIEETFPGLIKTIAWQLIEDKRKTHHHTVSFEDKLEVPNEKNYKKVWEFKAFIFASLKYHENMKTRNMTFFEHSDGEMGELEVVHCMMNGFLFPREISKITGLAISRAKYLKKVVLKKLIAHRREIRELLED